MIWSEKENSQHMKVVTWNILADQYIDYANTQRDYPTVPAQDLRLSKRLPVILRELERIQADLVLLQEVTPAVHEKLLKRFGRTYEIGPLATHRAKEEHGTSSGNVNLLKRSVFGATKFETKFFGGSQSATGIAFVKYPEPFLIANVHFDWENHARRKREAAGLLRYLRRHENPKVAVIIGGDFNTDQDDLHRKFARFTSLVTKSESTFLCEKPMIDWIYVLRVVPSNGTVHNEPVRNPATCFQKTIRSKGSDHYMVSGQLVPRT